MLVVLTEGSQWTVGTTPQGHVTIHDASVIEEEPVEELKKTASKTAGKAHEYTIELLDDSFRQEEYDIFIKYQAHVHDDHDKSKQGYVRFLCDSSLERVPPGPDTPSCGYGSFHMQHRIDGRLFAVGVLDILPSGASSVYLMYDPIFAFTKPGVISAIKELEFINSNSAPGFEYYYMGFYIPTCVKMRYKGEYHPTQIICPLTYNWVYLDQVQDRLDSLLLSEDVMLDDMNTDCDLKPLVMNANFEMQGHPLKLKSISNRFQGQITALLMNFMGQVGKEAFQRFVYSF